MRERQPHTDVSLPPFPSLKINKILKKKKKRNLPFLANLPQFPAEGTIHKRAASVGAAGSL